MIKEWKDIEDFPNYQVSNINGEVRNKKTRRVLQSNIYSKKDTRWRYHQVTLYKEGKGKVIPIHRLVAKAFVPNPNNYNIVTFKDDNIHNLDHTNLQWVLKL